MNTTNTPPIAADEDSVDLFDYAKLKDYFLFVIGAVRRHVWIVLAVFGVAVGFTLLTLALLPKTYHVEAKLLGQRNQVISSLAVPGRAMPNEADAPARAAGETVKSRDSLLYLIKQTDLVKHFYSHRSRGGAIKDWLFALFGHFPSEEEKLESVLGLLDARLMVTVNSSSWQGEGTVNIAVDWPDQQMAHHLVGTAQQNFVEMRHVSELSNISEAISILEGHAAQVREEVEAA